MKLFSKYFIFIALFVAIVLQSRAAETNGIYYVSSGEKADAKIFQAHIYSENNANTDFSVRLENVTNPAALRISGHEYSYSGWSGTTKWFRVHGQDEAEAVAKQFSVTCDLRSPPGYKLYAQFVPSKAEFDTNEPV